MRRVGVDALLVECESLEEAMALRAEAVRREVAARDLVPAARSVLFDGVAEVDRLAREVLGWPLEDTAPPSGPLVEIPTSYDGPDLADVARLWDMTTAEVVATHRATEFAVAFCGFAPGFAYLTGLPRQTPRLDTPRTTVPAGAVGVAGGFTGVYPRPSPGGWRLIGSTRAVLWDTDRDPPALLVPGGRVRFVDA